jgi:PadR family transcriptional regulator, regulatory protein PadR
MSSHAGPGTADPLVGELRRSGLVSLLVLHYLAAEPCCGNQLMERIATLTEGTLAVNPNTMYPLLHSLEARGLIAGAWERPNRRSRRCYRITDTGEAERRRLAIELEPNLEAVAATIDLIRHELVDTVHGQPPGG